MQTLTDGERNFCSRCGLQLVESFEEGSTYSRIRCPKWGRGIINYDLDHDRFIGEQVKRPLFDPITGKKSYWNA